MAFIVEFEPTGIRLVCEEPLTVGSAARQAGVGLRSDCGGKATCGQCLVQLEPAISTPFTYKENQTLNQEQRRTGWRLACQAVIEQDTRVYVPPETRLDGQVTQVAYQTIDFQPEPWIHPCTVTIPPPTLADQLPDFERVARAVEAQAGERLWEANLTSLAQLSRALRQDGRQITAVVGGGELVATYTGRHPATLGFAADIGTTKLACYLIDLASGNVLAAKGILNPQIFFGEDVISRLETVLADPANAARLQKAVINALNQIAEELCRLQGADPAELLDCCLVGNTAMHHLLLGLPVQPLAVSPFIPTTASPLTIPAAEIGFSMAPGAKIHFPPPIAGFVGSDHLAFLLAAGFGKDNRTRLGIDIGTNTEIALQARGRIQSCSTASGPAFEGAHITHGMRAAPGAIERVRIGRDGQAEFDVIGGLPPVGICGSGILDALAEMLRAGLINTRGRIQEGWQSVRRDPQGQLSYILQSKKGPGLVSSAGREIAITQEDIHQILLAKGAIRAGIEILMERQGIQASQIDEVVLAGAFGSYLDPGNAVHINLFPDVPLSRIHAAGNAAGAGARMMLTSLEAREEAASLAKKLEYLELTMAPKFSRFFANGARLST